MEICEEEGFFHQDYDKFRATISEGEFGAFSCLKSDEQRFRFVNEVISNRFGSLWQFSRQIGCGKSFSKATEYKELGNKAFQYEQWSDALMWYNQAYLVMPTESDPDKAIIIGNRSAALFHLNKYYQALQDVDFSVQLDYPNDMRYKLMERKARCYFGMKDLPAALEYYRETSAALHYSNLSKERKDKWMKDTHKMIVDLDLRITNLKKYLVPIKHCPAKSFIPYVDKSLFFDQTETEGRFARTKSSLKPNHVVLRELPHASVVMRECRLTHCDNCCLRVAVLFCCPNCVDVVYCSPECQKTACSGYHRFECGFLSHVRKSGANVVCMLALRIVTQKSEDYFTSIKDELNHLTSETTDRLPVEDYRRIYNFVTHADRRDAEDSLKWILLATLLNAVLQASGFYKSNSEMSFIRMILLHNMRIVTYNSHEISELQRVRSHNPGNSVCIGAGLYPTLVLFNHSCDPGITRYFIGNAVCVRTVKNIPAGSVVAENYGQLFARSDRRDRRRLLKALYKFDCNCQACEEDWPTVYEMNPSMVSFKCAGTEGCTNGLVFTENSPQDTIKCDKCGELTDVNSSFESLKNTDMLNRYNEATRLHEQGEYERALARYAAIMNSLDKVLVKPYREYHLCQQGIRKCALELGSCYVDRK